MLTKQELEAALAELATIKQRHLDALAASFGGHGIKLIPSDELKDNEYIVSRGVYEAARRLHGEKGPVNP